MLGVIDEFAADGIAFESALDLCPELLVRPGVLTRRPPTAAEEADIEFGWELAKEMGRLDVGQSVAVKERAVLAVEAIEGTDRAIARAGELCRAGGFVVVKVAKPQQDMRFDVPTIGCSTIETLHRAGGRVLAIEAGKTILIDEERDRRAGRPLRPDADRTLTLNRWFSAVPQQTLYTRFHKCQLVGWRRVCDHASTVPSPRHSLLPIHADKTYGHDDLPAAAGNAR